MKSEYIYYSQNNEHSYTLEFFKLFGSFFIIFNNIIPISLTITFEIAKGIQIYRMEKDSKMKSESENFKVLSLKIHEDLGNVRYIFTDKTGTLTRNELEFKACSVVNRLFYSENKKQTNNEIPKIEENNDNNQVENNINQENNDENCSNEKLKKSMFANDFPLLSLKQALKLDFPINFNPVESENNQLHNNSNFNQNIKRERLRSDKSVNNYVSIFKNTVNNPKNKNEDLKNKVGITENCIVETEPANENDNSFNLKLNINRLIDLRNDYIPQSNINKNSNNNLINEISKENNSEMLSNSALSQSKLNEPIPSTNSYGLKLRKASATVNKQTTLRSDFDNISNASIKLLQKQQQTSKLIHQATYKSNYDQQQELQIENNWESSKELTKELFMNIALNHNVLLNKEQNNEISYQGPNPDEVALATCAHEVGIKFLDKDSNTNTLKLNIFGEIVEYEVLFKIPFESARKRSTIVVREVIRKNNNLNTSYAKEDNVKLSFDNEDPNQVVKIFIKGADNVIFDLIDENSKKYLLPSTKTHLDIFAKDGLRTLCYAVKYINYEDFQSWKANYNMLINKPNNNLTKTEKEIEALITELEKNSILLGVTGLEDKLQDEVKETINDLIEARIHMWMLTGDNIDTAESIGHSSHIFNDDTEVFKLKASESKAELKDKLEHILKELENMEREIMRLKLERKRRNKKSKSNLDNRNNLNNENDRINVNNAEYAKQDRIISNDSKYNKKNRSGKLVFNKGKIRSSNNLSFSGNNNINNKIKFIQNLNSERNVDNLNNCCKKENNEFLYNNIENQNRFNNEFAGSTIKELGILNGLVNIFLKYFCLLSIN